MIRSTTKTKRLALLGMGLLSAVTMTGCQVDVGGQTLPSATYLTDDIQYFPTGPKFKLTQEAAAMKAYSEQQAQFNQGPMAGPVNSVRASRYHRRQARLWCQWCLLRKAHLARHVGLRRPRWRATGDDALSRVFPGVWHSPLGCSTRPVGGTAPMSPMSGQSRGASCFALSPTLAVEI